MGNTIDLLCRLPHAKKVQELCDLAYEILGNPVFVSDLAHTILGYTKCVEISDPIWQKNIVQSSLERNTLRQEREVSIVHEGSNGARRPVLVDDDYMEYPRMIKVLTYRGQAVGVMVTTAYLKPFEEEDTKLIELIASFVEQRLIQERRYGSERRDSLENYFIKLLDGERVTRDQMRKRLAALGVREAAHTYALCVGIGHEDESQGQSGLADILMYLREKQACGAFMYNTCLVCVYGSDEDMDDWERQAPELAALFRREGLRAGVSRRLHGLEQLREHYTQAANALEIGLRLGRHDLFLRYDSLSSFTMFQMLPAGELSRCCHEKINALGEYDAAHGTELCATLQVYLEQAKSLARTSEILFVHRNTVRYRIKKCMELMNTDLENGNEIFSYILSLHILEFRRKFIREEPGKEKKI